MKLDLVLEEADALGQYATPFGFNFRSQFLQERSVICPDKRGTLCLKINHHPVRAGLKRP